MSNNKITALYERLSCDDENQGESNSIASQKELLLKYAREHGFPMPVHYTDDGCSGTRFDRPAFSEMMKAVENGSISVIITKDMSRIGRDYLKVGIFMEEMRNRRIRLIALNDSVDTSRGEDEFAPFRNMINEWYARDISNKIRASLHAKGMSGKPTLNNAPYGYLKSPEDKDKWVVDPEAAAVVGRIFRMAAAGTGPGRIARVLSEEQVEIPSVHMARFGQGLRVNTKIHDPYKWCTSTVRAILSRQEYLGRTVNFKTGKHFKDRKCRYHPKDEWMIFENTHEAIIDEKTFEAAQNRKPREKKAHPLLPYLQCADCGSTMYERREGKDGSVIKFVCSGYTRKPYGTHCRSPHIIKGEVVMKEIKGLLTEIKEIANEHSGTDPDDELRQILKKHKFSALDEAAAKLEAITKRRSEIRRLLVQICDEYDAGTASSDQYETLCDAYESELVSLSIEAEKWKAQAGDNKEKSVDVGEFKELLTKYGSFEEITPDMLADFIDCILIHERQEKRKRKCPQRVEVYLK